VEAQRPAGKVIAFDFRIVARDDSVARHAHTRAARSHPRPRRTLARQRAGTKLLTDSIDVHAHLALRAL
jgi:hypothetical protein